MTEQEKIEYKPISVREALTEMKDLSEIMIDLAYSSVLFHSLELAEEVLELEERVDTLGYILNMNAMLAVRDAEDAEALVGVTKVAAAADKISDAAADIAVITLKEIGIHPIVREAFEKVEERLTRVEVKPTSFLINKKLGDLELAAELGVDLIAIRRQKQWIVDPSEDEVVLVGDVLIARGAPLGVNELKGLAEREIKEMGVEGTSSNLFLTKDHSRKIVDKLVALKDTSELMIDLAYSSLLLNSRELAEEVRALEERVDDLHTEFELLVLSSGFKPEASGSFLGLIRLGVVTEEISDAAAEIAEVVLRGLKPHPILRRVIKEAEETVVRAKVSEGASLVGKKLREAQLHEETGMWVLVIRRGREWLRPRPDTVIEKGDTLICSGYSEGEEDLKELASGIQALVEEKV